MDLIGLFLLLGGGPVLSVAVGWIPALMLAGIRQVIRPGGVQLRELSIEAFAWWLLLIVGGTAVWYAAINSL